MQHDRDGEMEQNFERSSGNVFADLGLENSDELLVKTDLASAIVGIIRQNGWAQGEAAQRAGLTQPEISNIGRGKLDRFSQERLQTVLRRLGMDVEIVIHARDNVGIGTLRVRDLAGS